MHVILSAAIGRSVVLSAAVDNFVILSAAKDLHLLQRFFTTGIVLALIGCVAPRTVLTPAPSPPRTILARGDRLAESKRQIATGSAFQPAFARLIVKANERQRRAGDRPH